MMNMFLLDNYETGVGGNKKKEQTLHFLFTRVHTLSFRIHLSL